MSQRWARTIDAILQHNGYEGFLANLDESRHAFDADYDTVQAICATYHQKDAMTPAQWAKLLVDNILADKLTARGTPNEARSRATKVGQLFVQFVGAEFTVEDGRFRLTVAESIKSHRSKFYGFERVDDRDDDRGDTDRDDVDGDDELAQVARVVPTLSDDFDSDGACVTSDMGDVISTTEVTP
jgi:hypothetical protein